MARTKKKKVILSKQAKRRMADRTSKCYIVLTNLTPRLLYLVACWEWACVQWRLEASRVRNTQDNNSEMKVEIKSLSGYILPVEFYIDGQLYGKFL